MFLAFLGLLGCAYLGLGVLTLVFVLIDFYFRLPSSQRSVNGFFQEVLGWRTEWKEVAFVVFRWPQAWVGIAGERRRAREDAARMRELDARREERRRQEQTRWREESSVRRAAAVQAAKPPRKVRKAVARRQRSRS